MTLTSGTIVQRVLAIYRDQWVTLLSAAIIIFAVQLVVTLLFPGVLALLGILVAVIVSVFYQGMVVQLVRDVQDGRRDSSLGELFASVRPVAVPLLLVSLLLGLGVGIGFILLIVPGLFLLTIWSVAAPVTVVERPGVIAAFGRSRELVRGHGWTVFGVIVLIFLIGVVVAVIAGVAASALGDVGGAIVQWLASTLTAPISALAASVLYFALLEVRGGGDAALPPDPEAPSGWQPVR